MKIAITGATGFVGRSLVRKLHDRGDTPLVFSRDRDRARRIFPAAAVPRLEIVRCDPTQPGDWQGAVSGCDAVVNLAGAPLAEHRWTDEYKREIFESRQRTTRHVVEAIAAAEAKPSVLVSASAIGYYGSSEEATFVETSGSGDDFLAEVCQAWEAEARKCEAVARTVILRFGIVLGPGGAIAKMLLPFRLFAGGPLGSGRQWFSWIHRDDLTDLILQAIDNPGWQGVYNATAPNPVRMGGLCETLGDILNRPSWLPVPEFALEALLGEGAQVVLEGQKVLPERTRSQGFSFRYAELKPALQRAVADAERS